MTDRNHLSRIEWWKTEEYRTPPILIGEDEEFVREVYRRNGDCRAEEFPGSFLRLTKEVIFDVEGGLPVLHLVTYSLDAKHATINVGPSLSIRYKDDADEAWNRTKELLAAARLESVPVLANRPDVEPELIRCYREILERGFEVELDGEKVHVALADHVNALRHATGDLPLTRHWSPSEYELVRKSLRRQLEGLREAEIALESCRHAISELRRVLSAGHSEADLQACLTQHPLLWGTDYRRIIPKHRLGDDFEMDYALERYSGVVDLVEIESSAHPLYTQKNNPTHQLVHAEQQVLDWLDWIEQNAAYARSKLSGLLQPRGYVVIGRRQTMNARQQRLLARRNQLFRGAIEILTYDDLLDRAETVLQLLSGRNRRDDAAGAAS